MAFRIKVATTKNRFKINQGSLQVSSVKSYVEVTDDNYVLLGYLDALKDIRRIPDCSTLQAIKRMSVLIKALSKQPKTSANTIKTLEPISISGMTLGQLKDAINEKYKNKPGHVPLTLRDMTNMSQDEINNLKNCL
jgi:hypothetical protein